MPGVGKATDGAPSPTSVGIVGGGQLARMLCESASALGITTVVLAETAEAAAAPVATELQIGVPTDADALAALAARCCVVTFDHEQVDLALLDALAAHGVPVRPGTSTLALTVDKATMRARLAEAGIPVPLFAVLDPDRAYEELRAFADAHGWPVIAKAVRGGYDGKGVWELADAEDAGRIVQRARETGIRLLVEERVPIDLELAVLVARRPGGEAVVWPATETTQVEGICRETSVPGGLDPALAARAEELGLRVAEIAGAVGVLAVELFAVGGNLVVNELAARPHNSGHWTIEGSCTSQFENHLRAVLDLPLGPTTAAAAHCVSVNVLGGDRGDPRGHLGAALAQSGSHVHLYGKSPRRGRKLGHVTVCGREESSVRAQAWRTATALGNPPVADRGRP